MDFAIKARNASAAGAAGSQFSASPAAEMTAWPKEKIARYAGMLRPAAAMLRHTVPRWLKNLRGFPLARIIARSATALPKRTSARLCKRASL